MPLPITTQSYTSWAYLTGIVNEVKPAASFLSNLLFPNERTLPTEVIELSYLDGGRTLAPFVKINGEAKMVQRRTSRVANVMAPNIDIMLPMDAFNALIKRYPNTNVFVDSPQILEAYRQAIADDAQVLSDAITNRQEWMAAQMASLFKIDYTASAPDQEGDKFDITLPRRAALGGNTGVSLTGNFRWRDNGTDVEGSTSDPLIDFDAVKFEMSKDGNTPTMAICGRNAARAFFFHSKVIAWMSRFVNTAGVVNQKAQFEAQGARLLCGDFAGLSVWEYSQMYTDDTGTDQFFLDPNTVIFVSPRGLADNITYYGAIPDHEAFEAGLYQSKRFAKSWIQKTPSVRVQKVQSRPLPFCRRLTGIYTLKPTS